MTKILNMLTFKTYNEPFTKATLEKEAMGMFTVFPQWVFGKHTCKSSEVNTILNECFYADFFGTRIPKGLVVQTV